MWIIRPKESFILNTHYIRSLVRNSKGYQLRAKGPMVSFTTIRKTTNEYHLIRKYKIAG